MSLNFTLGSATLPTTLDIDPSTDSDVVAALTSNTPFPARDIQLGRISAKFSVPKATFSPSANTSVSMSAAASFSSGVAIDQQSATVLKALPLDPTITLDFQERPSDRFMLVSFGYTASGDLNATTPIGLLGSATFGVTGQSDGAYAVVYRFDRNEGADTVFTAVANSFKLPTQVRSAGDLQPGAWLVAEIDGSVAVNLAASLGYKLDYSKELKLLGVSHNLGVKIDAALTATLGFSTSGKFLLVLSRPSRSDAPDQKLHLQLFKQRKNGVSFGLELSAGIIADPALPDTIDDFLSSVFGIHGQQILNDLHSIENWTTGDLGGNIAALSTNEAKDLLKKVTGFDPDTELAKATGALKNALADWAKLAQNGSNEVQSLVWDLLGNPSPDVRTSVTNLLTGLSNAGSFEQTLSDALQNLSSRQWLMGIADAVGAASGLALGQEQSAVQTYANDILTVLNGSIITKLQQEISSQFDITKILNAADPSKLEQWVQDRLAAFLDKTTLVGTDLKQIQSALRTLGKKVSDLYAKTKSAVNSRYSLDFAFKYAGNTADTALLDVVFDMANPAAASLFLSVIGTGPAGAARGPTAIFATNGPTPGVTINQALLTHEIHSSATTHFAIPFLTEDTSHLNDTVATLAIEQDGAHLVASVTSKDQVQTSRYLSMLNLAAALSVSDGHVTPDPGGTIAYEMRVIRKNMPRIELVNSTVDFVEAYLTDKFPSRASYTDQFLTDFDITVSHALPNATNNFGDMAVSMRVAVTADLLSNWLAKRDDSALLSAQAAASRRIQTLLRKLTFLSYLQNLSSLAAPNGVAPLLVWCALPVAAGVDWDAPNHTLNAVDTGESTYWDWPDAELAGMMVNLKTTEKNLEAIVSRLYQRLVAAGDHDNAQFYGPDFENAASAFRSTVLRSGPQGQLMPVFTSLLSSESNIVGALHPASGVAKALEVASELANSADPGSRTKITTELAVFAGKLTATLNSGLSNIYIKQHLMTYGPMLLVEVSRVLAPQSAVPSVTATLQLLTLKADHQFNLNQFLTGSYPDKAEVAVAQTLVSGVA